MNSNKPLRIALVAPLLSRSATGLSSYVADLVPRLCDAGHHVTVLATDCGYRGAAIDEIVTLDPRVELVVFPVRGAFNRRLYRSPQLVRWLLRNVSRFDVVDIQGVWYLIAVDVARVCKAKRVPFIFTPHGMMTRWDWAKRPGFKRAFFGLMLREYWTSAAAVRYLSEGEFRNSMVGPSGPALVIPNGVTTRTISEISGGAGIREELRIPQDAPVVVFLGRVTEQKGVLEIVQAFDIASRECPEAVLCIAGPMQSEYGDAVRNLAESVASKRQIRVLGPVFGSAKLELLKAATVFVTLSRNEGMPIAALEALSFSKPAILTVDSNIPEVEEFEAGVITKLDSAAAARALVNLLSNRERLAIMSSNALHLVDERFSWKAVLPRLMNLYRTAAGRGVNGVATPELQSR